MTAHNFGACKSPELRAVIDRPYSGELHSYSYSDDSEYLRNVGDSLMKVNLPTRQFMTFPVEPGVLIFREVTMRNFISGIAVT